MDLFSWHYYVQKGVFEVDLGFKGLVVVLNPLGASNSCEEFACSPYVCVCSPQLLLLPPTFVIGKVSDPKLTFAVNVSAESCLLALWCAGHLFHIKDMDWNMEVLGGSICAYVCIYQYLFKWIG